jgi:phosphoribosylglycinamide formyltransferase
LPGAYDGAGAIRRAYEDFQTEEGVGVPLEERKYIRTGAMLRYVISEVDRGEPILVREVEFRSGESLEELEERIHEVEHEIIVAGIELAIARLWEERRNTRDST